jgi:hypothetical protein
LLTSRSRARPARRRVGSAGRRCAPWPWPGTNRTRFPRDTSFGWRQNRRVIGRQSALSEGGRTRTGDKGLPLTRDTRLMPPIVLELGSAWLLPKCRFLGRKHQVRAVDLRCRHGHRQRRTSRTGRSSGVVTRLRRTDPSLS